jgi:hypothetical protein
VRSKFKWGTIIGEKIITTYNTNLASEFYVLSMLHRLGFDATLTLGNKKSVDIVIIRGSSDVITVDVKGLAGTTLWPLDNVKKIAKGHFFVFLSFLGKIGDYSVHPEIYILPSEKLEEFIYYNPKKTRRGLRLSRMRNEGQEFKDAWHLLRD